VVLPAPTVTEGREPVTDRLPLSNGVASSDSLVELAALPVVVGADVAPLVVGGEGPVPLEPGEVAEPVEPPGPEAVAEPLAVADPVADGASAVRVGDPGCVVEDEIWVAGILAFPVPPNASRASSAADPQVVQAARVCRVEVRISPSRDFSAVSPERFSAGTTADRASACGMARSVKTRRATRGSASRVWV
jgi:hypothetical protein